MPRVLVIDDDRDLREMIRFVLQQTDYDVLLASDGLEGMRVAWHEHPDAILLDVMMPMMDGQEVLHRLKSAGETADIPVIMLTAVSAAKRVRGLIEAGAADYVVKPFEPNRLIERLERALVRPGRPTAQQSTTGLSFVVAHPPGHDLDLLVRYLGAKGRVTTTSSGMEALASILSEPRAVALLGPGIEDLDAASVADRLRNSSTSASTYIVGLVPQSQAQSERLNLLGAGFDEVLGMPATLDDVAAFVERAGQPRSTYNLVRNGVVVLMVVGVDAATSARKLRDAFIDFIGAKLTRFLVDLSEANGAAAALTQLRPFIDYVVENGIEVRFVVPHTRLNKVIEGFARPPLVFTSLEEALQGWS